MIVIGKGGFFFSWWRVCKIIIKNIWFYGKGNWGIYRCVLGIEIYYSILKRDDVGFFI